MAAFFLNDSTLNISQTMVLPFSERSNKNVLGGFADINKEIFYLGSFHLLLNNLLWYHKYTT